MADGASPTSPARRVARRAHGRVVFLDFDGTVTNDAWVATKRVNDLAPELVARVDALCVEMGAAVMVASAWRCFTALDDLRAGLTRAGLTVPVLGAVDHARGVDDGRDRFAALWLALHPEVTSWVVLDDAYPWSGAAWQERVVVPDGAVGVTDADIAQAAKILAQRAR